MKAFWLLLLIVHYGMTKKFHKRQPPMRKSYEAVRRRHHINNNNHHNTNNKNKNNTNNNNRARNRMLEKRDEITDAVFDENNEFGKQDNTERRSGVFRNNQMFPYLPFNSPMAGNIFRNRDPDDNDGPDGPDGSEEREEANNEDPSPIRRRMNSFSPYPFINPMGVGRAESFRGGLPNPEYAMRRDDTENDAQHQLDDLLDNYMYRIAKGLLPERSSLTIPRDIQETSPETSANLPNVPLMFPPYSGILRDQTVVPNAESTNAAPQGEMQVGPRPLDPRFFQSQQSNDMMDEPYHRNEVIGSSSMSPFLGKPRSFENPVSRGITNEQMYPQLDPSMVRDLINPEEAEGYREPFSNVRKTDRQKKMMKQFPRLSPDEGSFRNLYDKIDSDEADYKKKYGNQLVGTRKNFVQRNYRGEYPAAEYRMTPYDEPINTGDDEQNELENKYQMVLGSMINTNNFPRNLVNDDNNNNMRNMFPETNIPQSDRSTYEEMNFMRNYAIAPDRSETILGTAK